MCKPSRNEHLPRYCNHNTSPPPQMPVTMKYANAQACQDKVRHWACLTCGTVNLHAPVFTDKWDFTTDRYCPICKAKTEHDIRG